MIIFIVHRLREGFQNYIQQIGLGEKGGQNQKFVKLIKNTLTI